MCEGRRLEVRLDAQRYECWLFYKRRTVSMVRNHAKRTGMIVAEVKYLHYSERSG